MRVKKLEIFGFKSFAQKTTIHFEPGVTAIVGPNGSGKSNLVDSIRWVLGEHNPRDVRAPGRERPGRGECRRSLHGDGSPDSSSAGSSAADAPSGS
mgnify:CR=1 FL=1